MTQLNMDDILGLPPSGPTPAEPDTPLVVALATSIVRARSILFSALVQMEQRPKPWTNRDKALRLKIAKAVGVLVTAQEKFPNGLQRKALQGSVGAEAPH